MVKMHLRPILTEAEKRKHEAKKEEKKVEKVKDLMMQHLL
jgi:hypothetical protein